MAKRFAGDASHSGSYRHELRVAFGLIKFVPADNEKGGRLEEAWTPLLAVGEPSYVFSTSDNIVAIRAREVPSPIRGARLRGQILHDGELCGDNNNGWKTWRDALLCVVGNTLQHIPTISFDSLLEDYIDSFSDFHRTDSTVKQLQSGNEPYPNGIARAESDLEELKPIRAGAKARPPRLFVGSASNPFRDALHEAGWTINEMTSPSCYLDAIRAETLTREFTFYQGYMHFRECCKTAPPRVAIVSELTRLITNIRRDDHAASVKTGTVTNLDIWTEKIRKGREIVLHRECDPLPRMDNTEPIRPRFF